jgi:hypothetical protein
MKKANIFVFILSLSFSFMANAISLEHLDSDVESKREQLTTVQLNDYLKGLKGTKVNWRGKVSQVTSSGGNSDKYRVSISSNSEIFILSLYISGKQHALILNKNQEYDFSGEIVVAYESPFISSRIELNINITEYK